MNHFVPVYDAVPVLMSRETVDFAGDQLAESIKDLFAVKIVSGVAGRVLICVVLLGDQRKMAEDEEPFSALTAHILNRFINHRLAHFGSRIFGRRQMFCQEQAWNAGNLTVQVRDMFAEGFYEQAGPDLFSVVIARYYQPRRRQRGEEIFSQLQLLRLTVVGNIPQDDDQVQ